MNVGPVTPSSNTNSRSEIPTCGPASPTPGASYIVSSMSCARRRSRVVEVLDGLRGRLQHRVAQDADRDDHVGCSTVRTLTGAVPPRPARRCRAPRDRGSCDRNASTRPGSSASKHTVCSPTDETSIVMGSHVREPGFERIRADDPEHGGPDREPCRRASRSPRPHGTDPGCRAPALGSAGRPAGRPARSPCPRGAPIRPPPSRSPRPARATPARAGAPRDPRRGSRRGRGRRGRGHAPTPARPRGSPSLSATEPCLARRRGGPATEATVVAHSSTRSAPPRRIPKSCAPQCAHRPGASHTMQRTVPSSERSAPPHAAHAAGRPHERQTCAIP